MNAAGPRSCLTEAEFEELGRRGDLSPGREAELQRHLEGCVSCRTRWEERRGDEEMFRELRAARKEPAFAPGDSPGVNLTRTHAPSDGNAPSPMLPPDLAVTIEGYSITREIGRGGMGVVFEAIQQRLNRKVALKILPGGSSLRDRDAVNRFRREATAAARLHHTHIVPVYDFGQSGVAHYYAMELVEGRSMTDMIRRLANANAPDASPAELERLLCDATDIEPGEPGSSGTFDRSGSFAAPGSSGGSFSLTRTRVYYRHVARWMADAADALNYAHDQGIIHRDIKPSNLLLARDGRIMILDFGLAKSQGDHSVTMTGAIVGTLRYMSPEQAMAKRMKVDHRTDIYSLGATLYELLAFQPAFAGHDDKETLGLIITRDATAPRKIISTVPRELETICLKTLEKDPGARYQTARELAEDLRRFIEDRPILAKPLGPLGRSVKFMRRRRAATVAALSILLLSASVLGIVSFRKRATRAEEAKRVIEAKSKLERIEGYIKAAGDAINDGDYELAVTNAQSALDLDSANQKALINFATAQRYRFERTIANNRDMKIWEEAVAAVDKALAKEPKDVRCWNLKGVLMRLAERYDEAIEAHKQGVALEPDKYFNLTSLANPYVLKGDFKQAEEHLIRATQLKEGMNQVMPWHNLCALQLFLGKPEGAKIACDRALANEALAKKGQSARTRLLKAKVLLCSHLDPEEAFDLLAAADGLVSEDNGDRVRIKRYKALAELRRGRAKQAIDSAQSAISLGDSLPFSYLILAIAEVKSGQYDEAANHYRDATITLWPRDDTKSVLACEISGGMLWIDSMNDLKDLRREATEALEPAATSQPTIQAGG